MSAQTRQIVKWGCLAIAAIVLGWIFRDDAAYPYQSSDACPRVRA